MVPGPRTCALVAGALLSLAACAPTPAHRAPPAATTAAPSPRPVTHAAPPPRPVTHATPPPRPVTHATPPPRRITQAAQPPRPVTHAAPRTVATGLPLGYSTGTATRVITVVAPSTGSTTGTLQAWQRAGSGWTRRGAAVTAHLGSAGLTSHPSESESATPIGSFTLTEAFGHYRNPGTALPYTQTTPADWWISQPGPLYNTMQRCPSRCAFTQGDPNERVYYETPFYDYAVVIDYNRAPVAQGAGSAFFLHVTDGNPTAGCVAIPTPSLLDLMGWLTPAEHPRILIGVGS